MVWVKGADGGGTEGWRRCCGRYSGNPMDGDESGRVLYVYYDAVYAANDRVAEGKKESALSLCEERDDGKHIEAPRH